MTSDQEQIRMIQGLTIYLAFKFPFIYGKDIFLIKKSYLVLHTAVLLAGFTGVFGKLITLNQIPLVWFRVLLSTLILFVVLKLFKIERLKSTKDILNIARGGLLLTIHWIFFYGSIKFSNISIGVVCYCLTSFFTAILEPIINKKRFSAAQLMLSMLTLIGISLIFHFDSSYQVGIILGLISTIFAALYTIYNERLVKQYDSKLLNYYQMLSGTIVLGLGLPIFYYLFPTERFIPSFIIAFLFFNEGKQVNASFYVGLAFVLVSVLLQTLRSIQKKT